MKRANPDVIFTKFETGVDPPPARNQSKYKHLVFRVLEIPLLGQESEWCRFQITSKKMALNAKNALNTASRKWKKDGHHVRCQVVDEPGSKVWLYVQRYKLQKGDKHV